MTPLKAITLAQILEIAAADEAAEREADALIESSGVGEPFMGGRIYNVGTDFADPVWRQIDNLPSVLRVKRLVRALSLEALIELEAVMWIGRGTEDPKHWKRILKYAAGLRDEGRASYLLGKPLRDYLPAGLRRLGHPVPSVPSSSPKSGNA